MVDEGPEIKSDSHADASAEMTSDVAPASSLSAKRDASVDAGAASVAPRPNAHVAARIEELLREQLEDLGVKPSSLSPQDIVENMTCALAPDSSMTYAWRGTPLLHITPEIKNGPDGESVLWRMFTRDDMAPGPFPAP